VLKEGTTKAIFESLPRGGWEDSNAGGGPKEDRRHWDVSLEGCDEEKVQSLLSPSWEATASALNVCVDLERYVVGTEERK